MEIVYKNPALGSGIKNRAGEPVEELTRTVTKEGVGSYEEVYYLDKAVDPSTGMIMNHLEPHYTKEQVEKNYAAYTNAYYKQAFKQQ